MRLLQILLGAITVAIARADDNPMAFHSSARQTALLELYTSEGCSSCPPAETWLSHLVESPRLWQDFVPVTFHVDYWDHLGWRDPLGAEVFSDRQRSYAASWRSARIYTPEFVLNGKEWRSWATRKDVPENSSAGAGVLSVTSTNMGRWQVHFSPMPNDKREFEIHACLLASGVKIDVKAGENEGKRLTHDFAALSLTEVLMTRRDNGFECKLYLPTPTNASSRLAIAVWITEPGKLEPIQATGGWLPKSITKP